VSLRLSRLEFCEETAFSVKRGETVVAVKSSKKIAGLRGLEIAYNQLIDPPCAWIVKPAKVEIIPAPSPPPSECGRDYFCRAGF
jgi:hypothetical protein